MEETPFRVLIVEDSATIRYAYKRLLEPDYDLAFAEDPLGALRQVATVRPDVVVLDINLTSRDGLIDKVRGKMARADRYLTKPVDHNVLRSTLRDMLSEKTVARR